MKHILLTSLLLFGLTACGEDEKKLAEQAKQLQKTQTQNNALVAEIKAKDAALLKAREEAKAIQEKLLVEEEARKKAFLKAQKEKERLQRHQTEAAIQNKKLSQVGIQVKEDEITINTKKTKDFFEQLGKTFENKIKKITQDLEKGMLDEQDAGVKIDETHINIDLNKTKDFLEGWGKKLQGFVQDFDSIAKELDTQTQQIQNTHPKGN